MAVNVPDSTYPVGVNELAEYNEITNFLDSDSDTEDPLSKSDDKARLGKKKKKEKKEKSQQKKSDKLLRPWYHSGDTWYKPADPSLQHVEGHEEGYAVYMAKRRVRGSNMIMKIGASVLKIAHYCVIVVYREKKSGNTDSGNLRGYLCQMTTENIHVPVPTCSIPPSSLLLGYTKKTIVDIQQFHKALGSSSQYNVLTFNGEVYCNSLIVFLLPSLQGTASHLFMDGAKAMKKCSLSNFFPTKGGTNTFLEHQQPLAVVNFFGSREKALQSTRLCEWGFFDANFALENVRGRDSGRSSDSDSKQSPQPAAAVPLSKRSIEIGQRTSSEKIVTNKSPAWKPDCRESRPSISSFELDESTNGSDKARSSAVLVDKDSVNMYTLGCPNVNFKKVRTLLHSMVSTQPSILTVYWAIHCVTAWHFSMKESERSYFRSFGISFCTPGTSTPAVNTTISSKDTKDTKDTNKKLINRQVRKATVGRTNVSHTSIANPSRIPICWFSDLNLLFANCDDDNAVEVLSIIQPLLAKGQGAFLQTALCELLIVLCALGKEEAAQWVIKNIIMTWETKDTSGVGPLDVADAKNGWRALHYAVLSANEKILTLLVDSGADWTAQDDEGLTPYDLALLLYSNPRLKLQSSFPSSGSLERAHRIRSVSGMDSSTSAPPTTKERKSTANGASSCGTEMQENERISGLLLQKFDNIAESSIKRALDSLRKATSAADKQEYNQRIRTFASCVANRKLLLNLLWDETAQMGGDVILHNVIDQSELNVRKIIGSGGFGKVVQAKWRGEEIAVKFIDQNSPDFYYENFKAECTILTLLQHPCIVPMYGAGSYKTPENKNGPPSSGFFLAMMLMTGNLRDQIKSSDVLAVLPIAMDTIKGLVYIHEHELIHRDIKPDNILYVYEEEIGRFRYKLADFGIARADFGEDQNAKTCCGTEGYMAPELLTSRCTASYNSAVDIWSFGIVMWEIIHRRPAPAVQISQVPIPFDDTKHIPEKIISLVFDCLNIGSPHKRPTALEIEEIFEQLASSNTPLLSKPRTKVNDDDETFVSMNYKNRDDDIFLQQLAVKEEEGGGVKHVFGKAPALLKGRDGGEKSSPSSTETGGVRDFLTYCREVRLDGLSNEELDDLLQLSSSERMELKRYVASLSSYLLTD